MIRRALCAAAILFASAASAAPPAIIIATGQVAGFTFPLGGEICRLYEQSLAGRGRCSVVATDGSMDNLDRLRSGNVDAALVQSDRAAEAIAATGPFAGKPPFSELRSVVGFYADSLTLLARADGPVKTVDDLKGKRISVGEAGAADPLFADFLEGLGWTKADFGGVIEMPRNDQIAALCGGKIDAIAVTAPHPNGFVREALGACRVRMLDLAGPGLDAAVATHRAYAPVTIDATTYGALEKPVQSFGPRTILVTTSKLPDDIAARLTAVIFGGLDALRKAHPAFAGFDRVELASPAGLGAERHPGAGKYLADNKLIEPSPTGE